MFNVYNVRENYPIYPQSYKTILENLLNNIGDIPILETESVSEADVFLMFASVSEHAAESKLIQFDYFSADRSLFKLMTGLLEKPVILVCDTHGPTAPKNYSFDFSCKENDIPVGWASLPKHNNAHEFVGMVSSSDFRNLQRWERIPNSLIMVRDNFERKADEMLEIIPLFDEVFVTNVDAIQDPRFVHFKNLRCGRLDNKNEVLQKLNQYQYILSTREDMGLEMMGVEGFFCGCQPIYPDTDFYRDVFKIGGVEFYDTKNVAESISAILDKSEKGVEKDFDAFVDLFSVERSAPLFWQRVFNILDNKDGVQ